MWDITVLLASPPASWSTRRLSAGDFGSLPGWISTGQPNWAWAAPVACKTFFSLAEEKEKKEVECSGRAV